MKLALITMGGTIDKDYFDALSEYQVVDSIMLAEVARLGIDFPCDQFAVCSKDSLEIVESDREALLQKIQSIDSSHVLVSHGTDTMVDTARFIQSRTEKTVVFFGAMRPSRFKDSDAMFNFAFALGALKSLDSGVYVAMSANLFRPDEVTKNRDAGRFELSKGS